MEGYRGSESDPENIWPLNAARDGPCWGNARHRLKHAAIRLPPAGPPEAHAEYFLPQVPTVQTRPVFFFRRRQRYKHASVLERPPQSYGQRLELTEGSSPRGLTCHYTDKAGYIYSAPLYNCRVVLLLLRQRRGAGFGELQRARGRSKYFAIEPAHTKRALQGP
jgi:hypothetical protein